MKVFFDTNLLAYQFDDSRPAKQARARDALLEHFANAVISTQVLVELHSVLTRKLGRSRDDALTAMRALDLEVVPADSALVLRAADTALTHDLSIFDALILEAAVRAGCEELWTEDLAHDSRLRGVRIVDPFRDVG